MKKKKKHHTFNLFPIALKVSIQTIVKLNDYYNIDLIKIYRDDFINNDFELFINYVDKLKMDMKGGEC